LILMTAWSTGVGLRVLRWLGPAPEEPIDAMALAVPIGLGGASLALLGLGQVGLLGANGIAWGVGVGFCGGGGPCIAWLLMILGGARRERPPLDRLDRVFATVLAVSLVGTLLSALAPVTDGDALCYHLQVPKWFLERGSVGFDPDLHETVYPLLV